jgi:dTDP-4-dehydrorhamnose 3,5-epimerase
MQVHTTPLAGLLLIEPRVFGDARGCFLETFHAGRYAEHGVPTEFVQDNLSRSGRGTLRGLHYQRQHPQGKLVFVTHGAVFDVAVDLRRQSPTFGRWHGVELNDENRRQLYIPPGFAHGFCVLSETADFAYKCTDYYRPDDERTLLWNDPAVGVEWPEVEPRILSDKDRRGVPLSQADVYD